MICDLAETYNIYEYKDMPPKKVAIFCIGLRENSRLKLKLQGLKVPLESLLLADIRDKINLLLWAKTKDGQKNRNRPSLIAEDLIKKKEKKGHLSYSSGKEWEDERKRILEEINGNGN